MGQEQSYVHASTTQRRYKENAYEDPIQYRNAATDYRTKGDYKRHKPRRSTDSFTSDTTQSSGYRTSSTYDYQSSDTDYYRLSLYKNDHYKDSSKEIYKPVKLPKEKRYKRLDSTIDKEAKTTRIQSYLNDTELSRNGTKKAGIRNYTPKILSEDEKKVDDWV